MSDLYTTKTATLKAIKADVRNLDAKKINLKGKDILEYINEATPTIKHANDTRETVTENDLWGQYIETKSDGTIIVHDDWVTNPGASNYSPWHESITNVEDNKAYTSSGFYANIQTEKIKDGEYMFYFCSNLTSFNSDLSSLTNGYSMFYKCSNLTSFASGLSSLTNGYKMFNSCTNLTSFSSDLSSLTNGYSMFYKCSNLTSFSSDSIGSPVKLSSLTNGNSMFSYCSNLTSFTSDLSSMTNGSWMFNSCTNLTSFTSDLSSMTNGSSMFNKCSNLTSFSSNLSSLTSCYDMFNSCTNLTSFSSDLSSLTNGERMFYSCSNLTSFSSVLSSLTNGSNMFNNCKLDAESVMYVADSIKDITAEKQLYSSGSIPYVTLSDGVYSAPKGFMSDGKYVYTYNNYDYTINNATPYTTTISASNVGKLTIGINVTNNADTIQQQLEDFAKAAIFESWDILKTYFSKKGWTVTFIYGGTTDAIPDTYGLRGGERIIPCPIFAKLVQVEDKDSAHYCTEDASTFYNIDWGHDVTNPQDFQQFDSLEDAMRAFNVFPKENIIS